MFDYAAAEQEMNKELVNTHKNAHDMKAVWRK